MDSKNTNDFSDDFDWGAYDEHIGEQSTHTSPQVSKKEGSSVSDAPKQTESASFRDEVIKSTYHKEEIEKQLAETVERLFIAAINNYIEEIKSQIKKQAELKDYNIRDGKKVISGKIYCGSQYNQMGVNPVFTKEVTRYPEFSEKYAGIDVGYDHMYIDTDIIRDIIYKKENFFTGRIRFKERYSLNNNAVRIIKTVAAEAKKEGIRIGYGIEIDSIFKETRETHYLRNGDTLEYHIMYHGPSLYISYAFDI